MRPFLKTFDCVRLSTITVVVSVPTRCCGISVFLKAGVLVGPRHSTTSAHPIR